MRIAICDDNKEFRNDILEKLEHVKEAGDTIKPYKGGVELLESCKKGYYHDLTLLDVKMPFLDGMRVAEKIRQLDRKTEIVVLTNYYEEYAPLFYKYKVRGYYPKPVSEATLKEILDDARLEIRRERFILLKTKDGSVKQAVDDIYYLSYESRKLTAHTTAGGHEFYGVLKDISQELQNDWFYQIHQAFTVSLYYVKNAVKYTAYMANGDKLPIARDRYPDFMRAYTSYIGGGLL